MAAQFEVIHPCCAGLDVHPATIWACARQLGPDHRVTESIRQFGTTTAELLGLADWLQGHGVRIVAMESTGVYWKPVFNVLEDRFPIVLANAQHLKKVPGRKTDVIDCQWIAKLLQCGLVRNSFVPPRSVRQLRDLTRRRTQLTRERAGVVNRIQKVLEDANVKLAGVASDVMGVSGRAMITAITRGTTDPAALADLARGGLRKKIPALKEALSGLVNDHHRFLLREALDQVNALDRLIGKLTAEVERALEPESFSTARQLLVTIPGVDLRAADVLIAEIGVDMSKFPTAGHLCSWAGLSPGNDQSGKRRRQAKTTKGSQWLRTTLVQVAWAASHTKETKLSAQFRRQGPRLGKKKALIALAHKILVIVHRMLKDHTAYQELPARPHPCPEA
jgi:transposase